MTMHEQWSGIIDAAKAQNTHGISMRGTKRYTTVAVRVEIARRYLGDRIGIETEIIHHGLQKGEAVVVRAIIRDFHGRILATGTAEEIRGQGQVNTTSALENAETSAIGRALAVLGLSGGEFASANEMDAVDRKKAHTPTERPVQPHAQAPTGIPHDREPHDMGETPHDENGKIPDDHRGSLPMTSDTPQAWIDGIRDKLGKGATKRQLAAEYAAMLITKAESFKPGPRAKEWVIQFEQTHSAYIDKLPPDLRQLVSTAIAAARDREENPDHDPSDFRDVALSEDPSAFLASG